MAATIAVPFWAVGMLLFVFGVLVGKLLFEPPGVRRTRPPVPPDPYQRPSWSAGWQPTRVACPENIKPPPKKL